MSRFLPGDVVLAPVRLGERSDRKTRPVVVLGMADDHGLLEVLPVTRTHPGSDPHLSLDLADFAEGGLDLFETRYILITEVCTISGGMIRGKKGRLTDECLSTIGRHVVRD